VLRSSSSRELDLDVMGDAASHVNNAFAAWSMAHQRLVELESVLARCPVEACPDLRGALELQVQTMRHRADQLLEMATATLEHGARAGPGGRDSGAR
jgi:hypothetical protein